AELPVPDDVAVLGASAHRLGATGSEVGGIERCRQLQTLSRGDLQWAPRRRVVLPLQRADVSGVRVVVVFGVVLDGEAAVGVDRAVANGVAFDDAVAFGIDRSGHLGVVLDGEARSAIADSGDFDVVETLGLGARRAGRDQRGVLAQRSTARAGHTLGGSTRGDADLRDTLGAAESGG